VTQAIGLPDRPQAAGIDGQTLIGREGLVDKLAGRLAEGSDEVALTSAPDAMTLHGQGGIGKTALALEFCYSLAPTAGYELIWWVNADNETTTAESFRELLTYHGLQVDDTTLRPDVDQVLSRYNRWLAVFDNTADKDTFDRWRPNAGGQVLITTRSTMKWKNGVPVDLLEPEAAEQWLLAAAGDPDDPGERQAAGELVELLDGLALALSMAAAFISTTPVTLQTYLDLYRTDSSKLLGDKFTAMDGYDRTVYTALAVARDRLKTDHVDAAVLMLEYASFYAPDDIPMRLFTPDSLNVNDQIDVLQAKNALAERSLITVSKDKPDHFSVHRLIQDVTRHYLVHPVPILDDQGKAVVTDKRIFMSYRRADTEADCALLYRDLDVEFGAARIFRDVASIELGDKFKEEIDKAIEASGVVLALIGPNWDTDRLHDENDWVRYELEAALAREVPIIPLMLRGAQMPTAAELPESLQELPSFNAGQMEIKSWDGDLPPIVNAVKAKLLG
jgi:hypothetical protein